MLQQARLAGWLGVPDHEMCTEPNACSPLGVAKRFPCKLQAYQERQRTTSVERDRSVSMEVRGEWSNNKTCPADSHLSRAEHRISAVCAQVSLMR